MVSLDYSIDEDSSGYPTAYNGPENKAIALPELKFWGDGEWRKDAKCKGIPTNVFFPEIGKPAFEAQAICMTCPSRFPCAHFALTNYLQCGTYGGLTPKDRRTLTADTLKETDVKFTITYAMHVLMRSLDMNPVVTLARITGESVEWVEDKLDNDGDYLI